MKVLLWWKRRTSFRRITCQKIWLLTIIIIYFVCVVIGVGEAVIAPRRQQILPIADDDDHFGKQQLKSNTSTAVQKQQNQRHISASRHRPDNHHSFINAENFHFYPPVVVTRSKRSAPLKFARYDVSDWGNDEDEDDEKIVEPSKMLFSFDASKDGDDDSGDDLFHAAQERAKAEAAQQAAAVETEQPMFDDDEEEEQGEGDDAEGGDDDEEEEEGSFGGGGKLLAMEKKTVKNALASGGTFLFDADDDEDDDDNMSRVLLKIAKKSPPAKIVAHDKVVLRRKRSLSTGGNEKAVRKMKRSAVDEPPAFAIGSWKKNLAAVHAKQKQVAEARQDAYSSARRARREKSLAAGAFPQVGTAKLNHGDPDEQCPSGYYFMTIPQYSQDKMCIRFTRTPVKWGRAPLACERLSGRFMPMFPASIAAGLPFVMQHRGIQSFWIRQAYTADGSTLVGYMDQVEQPNAHAEWSPKQANKDQKFRSWGMSPFVLYVLRKPDPDLRKIFTIQTMPKDYHAYAMCIAPAKLPNNKNFRDGHRPPFHVLGIQSSKTHCPDGFRFVMHMCLFISPDITTYDNLGGECAKKAPGAKPLSMMTPSSMNLLSEILIRRKNHKVWILAQTHQGSNAWYWGPDLTDGIDRTQFSFLPGHGYPNPNNGLFLETEFTAFGQKPRTDKLGYVCVLPARRKRHGRKARKPGKANARLLAAAEAAEAGEDDAGGGGDKPVEAQNKILESSAVAAIAAPSSGTAAAASNAQNDDENKAADNKAAAAAAKAADEAAAGAADAAKKKVADDAEASKAEEAERQAEAAKTASAEQEAASKKAAEAEKAAEEAKDEAEKKAKEAEKQVDNAERAEDKLEQKAEEMKAGPTGAGGADDDDEKKEKNKGGKAGKPASDDWDPSHYDIHQIPLSAIESSSNTTFERLFGHQIMDLSKAFDNMPPEIATDKSRDAETARSLLMIMLSKWYRTIDQHHPNEISKKLLHKIMNRHKPRQCYATTKPVAEESDTVICLSTQGPIHLCYKEDMLDGRVARGCGIPDKKIFWGHSRCHVTTDGAFCFCESDVCNSANTRKVNFSIVSVTFSVALSLAFSVALVLLQ